MMPHMVDLLGLAGREGWPHPARRLNADRRTAVTQGGAGARRHQGGEEGRELGSGDGEGPAAPDPAVPGVGAAQLKAGVTLTTTRTEAGAAVTWSEPVRTVRVKDWVEVRPLMSTGSRPMLSPSRATWLIGPLTVTKPLGWMSTPVIA